MTGCNSEPKDSVVPTTPIQEEDNDKPAEDKNTNSEESNKESDDSQSSPSENQTIEEQTFEEFYTTISKNPVGYIQSILPNFQIWMDQQELVKLVGEPDQKSPGKNDWEDEVWVYDNIKGYRLQVQMVNQSVMNFQLMKSLPSTGRIPTIVNKPVPTKNAPLENSELGFEQVLIGFSTDEVLSRWGEPSMFFLTYDEMYGYDLALVYKGATVHVFLEAEKPYVHMMEANQYGSILTARGISIGSSVNEVIDYYGQPEYDWKETETLIYATSDYWFAIKFTISNDKVAGISIYEAS